MIDISDILGLGKLGVKILEIASKWIWIYVEPKQIVRLAKAEDEARQIEAVSKVKEEAILRIGHSAVSALVNDLGKQGDLTIKKDLKVTSDATTLTARALERFTRQEIVRQTNLESIALKAIKLESDDVNDDPVDDDWMAFFIKQAQDVSEEQAQYMWSRVLATETAKPGTISKRTMMFLSTLDKNEAAHIENYFQYVFKEKKHGHWQRPLIGQNPGGENVKYVPFYQHKQLEALGLFTQNQGWQLGIEYENKVEFNGIEFVVINHNSEGRRIAVELLTQLGSELKKISQIKGDDDFWQKWVEIFEEGGIETRQI